VHWREVGDGIQEANYALVGVAAGLLVISLVLRAFRWQLLFYPLHGLSLGRLFGALNVAYLINNILPFNLGDIGRAYLLGELEDVSTTRSLSTIVVERILDVLTLLVLLVVLVPFVDIPNRIRTPAMLLAIGAVSAAVLLLVASKKRGPVLRLVEWPIRLAPERFRPKLTEMVHSALDGFSVLSHPRIGLQLGAWSLVIWLTVGLVVFTGTEAFGLDIGFGAALFLVIVTTFGFFVPSSPGSFGVYHAIVIETLTKVFDINRNDAVSYALVIHLVFYLPPMFIGLAFLWTERRLWQRTSFLAKLRSLQGEPVVREASSATRS
jgi:uncharacterized protein (TIRG00374 family)